VEAKRKEGPGLWIWFSSTLLTICQTYKIKAGSILAVSDNVVTGEMGFMNPLYYMAEGNLIKIALEAVKKWKGKNEIFTAFLADSAKRKYHLYP